MIITSIQELRNKSKITSKVKKGEIYKALIIRTKKTFFKKDGTMILCNKRTKKNNSVILINKKGNLIGTRITEPIPFLLKKKQKKFAKLNIYKIFLKVICWFEIIFIVIKNIII